MAEKPTYEELEKRIQELEKKVSSLMKIETELKENEECFSEMFEHMPSGIAIYKPADRCSDFVFKAFNHEAEKITQISRREAIGRRLSELFPNMGKTDLFDVLKRVSETGIEEHIPPFYYKDKIREGWRENIVYRLPSGDIVAVFNDVTELKQAEQKIIQERKFLKQLMETSPVGITVVSRDGNISLANKLAEKTLGLQKSDIFNFQYNDPSWCITDFEGNPYPENKLPFNLVKKNNLPVYGVEHAIKWPDGKRILITVNAAPLKNTNDDFDGMVAIIEDITERKKTEKERDILIKKLQKALNEVKTLSGLLPICSHCKKIRDDKGYWNQLEEYFTKYSDAKFSHGICPDCIKEYYSDLISKDENSDLK
jgi:PAS domain S-box-containing protein